MPADRPGVISSSFFENRVIDPGSLGHRGMERGSSCARRGTSDGHALGERQLAMTHNHDLLSSKRTNTQ